MTSPSKKGSRHLAEHPEVFRPHPLKKFLRTHLLERPLLRLPRGPQVLDFCCGYGFYFGINPTARGVDGDPSCVAKLRSSGFDVTLCDVTKGLPFPDGEFSHVLAHDVFEHFQKELLRSVIAELHRVLQDGGRLIIIVPNRRGYDFGLRIGAGHILYVTREVLEEIIDGFFSLSRNFAFPLPRSLGQFFVHNKEYFELVKIPR